MPKEILRHQVEELVRTGAQLVEVLPAEEFAEEHLPGAINLPLADLDQQAPERLDRARVVVVYCFDSA